MNPFSFISGLLFLFLFNQPEYLNKKFNSSQLILVTTDSWNKITGKMAVYEYSDSKWKLVMKNIPIVTGRSGMAWAKGLHANELNTGILKKEGDGNSPAGIFYLSGLFGYQDIQSKMNSIKVNERTLC